jgi:formamidopyrimidine-DNA glycosylase
VIIEFDGSILQFSLDDHTKREPIIMLGPNALTEQFEINKVKSRMHNKNKMLLAEVLLDQTIICGIGNKYK